MSASRRITLGHGLMQLGIGLRVAAGCVAGSFLVALVGGVVVIPLAQRTGYPEPFGLVRHAARSAGLVTWLWQGAIVVAGAMLVGRIVAVAVGALGWSLLPRDHRELLERLTHRRPCEARDAGAPPELVPPGVAAPAADVPALQGSGQEALHP